MGNKIFVGNYKGGVGKTTSTFNIAVELNKKGYKVLIVDLDPQSSLSQVCLNSIDMLLDELDQEACLNYIYSGYFLAKLNGSTKFKLSAKKVIKTTKEGIDFIPNNLFSKYDGLDKIAMLLTDKAEYCTILNDFFKYNKLDEKYDFILFDCPPSRNSITECAFLLSDYYIIPTIMDSISSRAVKHYISTIEDVYVEYCVESENASILYSVFGEKPRLLGVFETMTKGKTNTDIYRNYLLTANIPMFETVIKHKKEISDNIGYGKEVSITEYKNLTDEVLSVYKEFEGVK